MEKTPFQDRFKELTDIERWYALLVYRHDLGKTTMLAPMVEVNLELVLEHEQVSKVLIVARREYKP